MIIQNGLIHDGVNPTPYEADIAIRDGVIAAIGPHLDPVKPICSIMSSS